VQLLLASMAVDVSPSVASATSTERSRIFEERFAATPVGCTIHRKLNEEPEKDFRAQKAYLSMGEEG
jgi:hypothetical protein